MGRKVFISCLGASFYNKCKYSCEGRVYDETRFIQRATLQHIDAGKWTEQDEAIILLTGQARRSNWHIPDGTRYNKALAMDEEYYGLKDDIKSLSLSLQVRDVDIPDGGYEEDIWSIFSIIYNSLQNGDEVYFDITHGYRYIPMLMIVFENYAKFMKNITIRSITYGNYENETDGVAPIVNLTPLAALQKWTFSAASFKEHGKFVDIKEDLRKEPNPNKFNQAVSKICKALEVFENNILTCRGSLIIENKPIAIFKENYPKITNYDIPVPIKNVIENINEELSIYSENSIHNLRNTINWCIRYNMAPQAYTLAQESIVTIVGEKLNIDFNRDSKDWYKKYRSFVSSILGLAASKIDKIGLWDGELRNNTGVAKELLKCGFILKLRREYENLTKKRNQVNHGGFTGNITAAEILSSMKGSIDACFDILNEMPDIQIQTAIKPKAFLNISNHPFKNWSETQLTAAREFGDLKEFEFPHISPETINIDDIVDEYLSNILELANDNELTVHIMGEMVFVYKLVKELKEHGIKCVASTTERDISHDDDGNKIVKFHFVQFREY